MTIEDIGGRVAIVWEGLRPATRSLVERALFSTTAAAPRSASAPYDARAEWELSRLLAALDDRATEAGVAVLNAEQARELRRMAETCALVLHNEARSAEVFALLLQRAVRARNYARLDALADTIHTRIAPSEICELARHPDTTVRAIAQEALLRTPTSMLVELLGDPVDADVAREAIERQAQEYGSEEARWIINALDQPDTTEDDL